MIRPRTRRVARFNAQVSPEVGAVRSTRAAKQPGPICKTARHSSSLERTTFDALPREERGVGGLHDDPPPPARRLRSAHPDHPWLPPPPHRSLRRHGVPPSRSGARAFVARVKFPSPPGAFKRVGSPHTPRSPPRRRVPPFPQRFGGRFAPPRGSRGKSRLASLTSPLKGPPFAALAARPAQVSGGLRAGPPAVWS